MEGMTNKQVLHRDNVTVNNYIAGFINHILRTHGGGNFSTGRRQSMDTNV